MTRGHRERAARAERQAVVVEQGVPSTPCPDEAFWNDWSGGIGAQPTHSGLVRHTTQPGLNSEPGTHIQP